MEKIFIGVAWPYANGPLHLGHLAGSLLAPDVFKRYHLLKGNEVLMVSGSDMHGTPITVHADAKGVSPEEIANTYHNVNKSAIERMNIQFDLYTSTHTENHFNLVKDIFKDLLSKGYIYTQSSEEPFCPKCNKFMPDRYIEGRCPKCDSSNARGDQCDDCGAMLSPDDLVEPKCKICKTEPVKKETEHFYFKLSAFEQRLTEYTGGQAHWRANTKNFTSNWLRDGLKDRPITRDITWGIDIPTPGYENKRIYVWFEAVCGYLSAAVQFSNDSGRPDLWKGFWQDPACRHYYFMGKDNIPFHTIIWPAILMGRGGLNLPYDIPANEYLTLNNEQFSKSRNHAIWLPKYLDRYPVDPLRFYLSMSMPENKDSDFTWKDFVRRNNTELVGALGNFVHRVLTFTKKNFGEIPRVVDTDASDQAILDKVVKQLSREQEEIAACRFKNGIQELMELCHEANRYFNEKKPWDTVNDDRTQCSDSLAVSIRIIKALSVMMYPYMPSSAVKLWHMLGESGEIRSWSDALKDPVYGHKLTEPKPLFEKLDLEKIEKQESGVEATEPADKMKGLTQKKEAQPAQAQHTASGKNQAAKEDKKMTEPIATQKAPEPASAASAGIVTIDDFQRMKLKVGKIIEIGDHPKANKLYVMKVDFGGEVRQIVAGLRPYYKTEELLNRQATFIVNLQPAELRGVRSEGMILAAEDSKGTVSVLLSDRSVENGAGVK